MKKIVVALDFSDASDQVLAKAEEMARAFGVGLHLVHVLEPQPSYSAYGFTAEEFPALQSYQKEAQQLAERKLESFAQRLRDKALVAEAQLAIGSPTHEMERVLESLDDPLLVVGTHGHNLVGSILLGSVAEALVRRALVPVLVVPIAKS